jgi:hypothetical protein
VAVFVLDNQGKALMPCTEKRARLLLARGRARVHRLVPMVIRLVDRAADSCTFQPLRLKLDPGSKTTGLALVRDAQVIDKQTGEVQTAAVVLNLMEIIHRGKQISEALTARRQMRRRRRNQLRYRAPRFLNRGNQQRGWLAPRCNIESIPAWRGCGVFSAGHRSAPSVLNWCALICKPCKTRKSRASSTNKAPCSATNCASTYWKNGTTSARIAMPKTYHCKSNIFTPKRKAAATGFLISRWLASAATRKKRRASIEDFLAKDPKRLAKILIDAKKPLRDAAAVNATRCALVNALKATGLPVELASGGQTKFNRCTLGIPKTHALDAACVGTIAAIENWQRPTLTLKATGRGSYQRTRLDKFGFPRGYLMRTKRVHGFGTGDMVRAEVPAGVKAGTHIGRVAVRASGSFNIQSYQDGKAVVVQGISHKHCRIIQRADGYGYFFNRANNTKREQARPKARNAARSALYLPGMNAEVSRAN